MRSSLGMISVVALYLLGISAATYAVFADDKRRAIKGMRRVPEKTLLGMALLGGTPGAMAAQHVLRHKTRKEPFRTVLWLITIVQVVILAGTATWLLYEPVASATHP